MPISITIAAIKSAQALFRLFMPRIKMPSTQNPRQGDPLQSARTKANQVRYGDIVREAFGREQDYPDDIVPQCRRFPSERTEWVQMLLAVGDRRLRDPRQRHHDRRHPDHFARQ